MAASQYPLSCFINIWTSAGHHNLKDKTKTKDFNLHSNQSIFDSSEPDSLFRFQERTFIPSLLRYSIPVTFRWPGGFPGLALITDDLPHLSSDFGICVQKYINNMSEL